MLVKARMTQSHSGGFGSTGTSHAALPQTAGAGGKA